MYLYSFFRIEDGRRDMGLDLDWDTTVAEVLYQLKAYFFARSVFQ